MTKDVTSTDNPPPAGVPVFAYAGAPRGEAYETWREEVCRRFCQLDAEPGGAERIECTVEVTRVGALSFGTAHGSSGSFLRTRSLLSDGCDDFVLVTALAGDVLNVQRGTTFELRPGDMGLLSLDAVGECGFTDGGRYTTLRIPRQDLIGVYRGAEDRLSKPLAGSPSLRDAVAGYYALCSDAAGALDAVGQHTMARHMTELVGLMLRTGADEAPPVLHGGYGTARLQLIQAQLLKRLGDGDLTIVSAARQAGLTPKQVQRLFWTTGVTFSEFVLEQRLLLAHRLLSGARGHREKISAIAYDAGFRDLSYFNRSFRRRFGMTPSEWRDAQPVYS
jgi:AraC-like DNA-binding protein